MPACFSCVLTPVYGLLMFTVMCGCVSAAGCKTLNRNWLCRPLACASFVTVMQVLAVCVCLIPRERECVCVCVCICLGEMPTNIHTLTAALARVAQQLLSSGGIGGYRKRRFRKIHRILFRLVGILITFIFPDVVVTARCTPLLLLLLLLFVLVVACSRFSFLPFPSLPSPFLPSTSLFFPFLPFPFHLFFFSFPLPFLYRWLLAAMMCLLGS